MSIFKSFCLMLVFALALLLTPQNGAAAQGAKKVDDKKVTGAVIETKYGDIEIKFFPDLAPGHVNNFVKLAREGFYDGTIFHRVIPGFMIQGGDPNTKGPNQMTYGTGGPGYTIKAEFNRRKHVRGSLAMARSQHPDSAGSQFYICYGPTPHLDGNYTVFGKVTSGMEHVDRIKQGDRMKSVTIVEE